jgi:alkylated DNA repair dioxygenase AlkB
MPRPRIRNVHRFVLAVAIVGLVVLLSATWYVRRHVDANALSGARRRLARRIHFVNGGVSDVFAPVEPTPNLTPSDPYFEPCVCTEPHTHNPDIRMQWECPMVAPPRNDALYARLVVGGKVYRSSSVFTGSNGTVAEVRTVTPMSPIPGLTARLGYVSEAEETQILAEINQHDWQLYYGKKAQEFGFNFSFYNPKSTSVDIPASIVNLAKRMVSDGLLDPMPNYVLVNRYEPGQGIHAHVDDGYYDGSISSVSLGAGATLSFSIAAVGLFFRGGPGAELLEQRRRDKRGACRAAYFPRGALFVMKGEARYGWLHEMARQGADIVPVMPDAAGALIGTQLLGDAVMPLNLAPGSPIRTNVTRELRTAITFRHVRDDVRDARWAGRKVRSSDYNDLK